MTTATATDTRVRTDTLVLLGTTKGLFLLRSGDGNPPFELSGPLFPGEEVYSTCIDTRSGSPRLFTGSFSNHWGPVLRRSDDLGGSWTEDDKASVSFPASDGPTLREWQAPRTRMRDAEKTVRTVTATDCCTAARSQLACVCDSPTSRRR